jgi:hypothetical protein
MWLLVDFLRGLCPIGLVQDDGASHAGACAAPVPVRPAVAAVTPMIAKKVTMRSQRKSSMADLIGYLTEEQDRDGPESLVDYMTDDQGKSSRVGAVSITHCHATTAAWAAAEMRAVQAMNTRAQSDKTYHMIVSFREGEQPPPDQLTQIEARLCDALGFAEHQRISVVHHDTDNLHLHIAINKIHPRSFRLHEPYYDHRTRSKVCAELEIEFDLERDNHQSLKTVAEANAANMTARTGIGSLLVWIQQNCQAELEQAASWEAFQAVLQSHELQIRQRANGFVFVAGDGTRCKASSVSRQLSMPALLARLGPMPAIDQSVEVIQPSDSPARFYRRVPTESRGDSSKLYAAYLAEQTNNRTLKAQARADARQLRDQRIEQAKRKAKLQRAAVKLVGKGLAAKLAYMTIRATLRMDIELAVRSYADERKEIQQRYPLRSWMDWLKARSRERQTKTALQSRGQVRSSVHARSRTGQERSGDGQELSR